MRITDAQVHLWQEHSPDQPWPEGARARAREHGIGPLTAEQILLLMDGAGVDRAVLVPATFAGGRNDLCLAAAAAHPDRFAVMGHIGADRPDIGEALAGWRDQPGMLGIRVTLSRGASQRWLEDGTLDRFWAVAEAEGIPLSVLPPDLCDAIGEVARRHPALRIVIDHLSLRTGTRDLAVLPAVEDLLPLADVPNVAVKATCLPAYTTEGYPWPGMQAVLRRVVDHFGAQRVFWGSDMSRLPGPYHDVVALFTDEIDFLSPGDLDWVMGRGLSQWLGWPT